MSREPVELLLALHFDPPRGVSRLVSETGDHARAVWLPKKLTESFHETGKTTVGTDRNGQRVQLPMVHMTIPEWIAKREGLI